MDEAAVVFLFLNRLPIWLFVPVHRPTGIQLAAYHREIWKLWD